MAPISTACTPLDSATRISRPEASGMESTGAGIRHTVSRSSVESTGGTTLSRRTMTGSDGLGCSGGPQPAITVATRNHTPRSDTLGAREAKCPVNAIDRGIDFGVAVRGGKEARLER